MKAVGPKEEDRGRLIDFLYQPLPWQDASRATEGQVASEKASFGAAMRQNGGGG